MPTRSHLSGAALFLCIGAGAAVLTDEKRPAIRAVLWEGVRTLSDSAPKPTPANKVARAPGKGGPRKGSGRLGEIGSALSAAYKDTLNEEVPSDILALLGKLD